MTVNEKGRTKQFIAAGLSLVLAGTLTEIPYLSPLSSIIKGVRKISKGGNNSALRGQIRYFVP